MQNADCGFLSGKYVNCGMQNAELKKIEIGVGNGSE